MGMDPNVASALCYVLGIITGIVFLVLTPYNQNRAIRFHAFQAIFLWVATMVLWVAFSIFSTVALGAFSYGMWGMVHLVFLVIELAIFLFWVFMIVSAYQGKTIVLPVIGQLAQKQA
jgi:uncharacterized membrane protein